MLDVIRIKGPLFTLGTRPNSNLFLERRFLFLYIHSQLDVVVELEQRRGNAESLSGLDMFYLPSQE